MRIKIIESFRSDKGYISSGTEQEVDDDAGMKLIRGGVAEEIGVKPKRARRAEAHGIEETDTSEGDAAAKDAA